MLAARRVESRYSVPIRLAEGAICVAAEKARAGIKTHKAMMNEVRSIRQQRIDQVVREFEARSRNTSLAGDTSDALPKAPDHLFEPRR